MTTIQDAPPLSTADRAHDGVPGASPRAAGPDRGDAPLPPGSAAPAHARDPRVAAWVADVARLTRPDRVVWCTGSVAEYDRLTREMVDAGTLIRLNPEWRPHSFLARSDPADVARVEDRTFICSEDPADAGPTNNWRDPAPTRAELDDLLAGSMRGRTLYVVPFSMGPLGGAISQLGVQITDSPYVVASMALMTRMGDDALRRIGPDTPWVRALHGLGAPLVDDAGRRTADVAWPHNADKRICHFPEAREIISFGSGYGGNALLGKKCFSLRIASVMARDEGWLAEHMLLIRVTSPEGRRFHVAAAFPSACGKTNLAMLTPTIPGWTVETLGDDIAWLRPDVQGRLRAVNPERGLFGVAPGTGEATNPNAMATVWGNAIFTNVALRPDGDVWWEGMTPRPPAGLVDWQGRPWSPASGTPAAHPNARFTVGIEQCPSLADDWDDPDGVVVDAILLGGRRATNVPLVAEAEDWEHGVLMGATMASERTAAAEGRVGELRHDPFAMQPFCGYDMADHWRHWLEVGRRLGPGAPRVFQVNWFRTGADGAFLWPGFGENARVLEWILRRVEDRVPVRPSPVGGLPRTADLDVAGLDLADGALDELLALDPASWLDELDAVDAHFARFDGRVPTELTGRVQAMRRAFQEAAHGRSA
ncbi:phosphoenolpyruvate carboxykinase (GTP) [Clavibacter michiganensis]|uniref:phosphoenolpyruvate carboxykinase (GTP) n=1 Tax=Clavibacter michiganensis TaxID=28447 RepID=UPI000CE77151|nr:phosphoenolpyruvate carboxykinase (GTP) [Clavibacter michiganensis]PPF57835.1 phosphoenolpyruvate carboxykinase (GTP) [Clavibacter michiganensis]